MNLTDYPALINAVLRPLIPEGASLALFDFPNYPNVGDSAIWLGQRRHFKEYGSGNIVTSDTHTIFYSALPKLPRKAVIVINGGGNFGDIYPHHQNLRLRLLEHYRQHRVIQLPQSIYFQREENFDRCSKVFRSHPDAHILVRDRQSLDIAKQLHSGTSTLCPDMALCLRSLPRTKKALHPIVALLRSDSEKAYATALSKHSYASEIFETDWLDEPLTFRQRVTAHLERLQSQHPRFRKSLYGFKLKLYDLLASERLLRGCDILSSGHVVITDRLHAHIMCSMMNIPHVLLDNSYRKISNFRDVWRTGEGLCRKAFSYEEAVSLALEMYVKSKKDSR